MKTLLVLLLACAFLPPSFADNQKEQGRVKESGEVLREILNIPDDIPQDLLDKAECLVILPSVKKGAFGIGGSFGRGINDLPQRTALYRPLGTARHVRP